MNYHTLSDFRVDQGDLLERVLTDSVTVLLHEGLITLDTVAQDGMRVRASAGSGSFRRAASLAEAQQQAQAHMDQLRQQQEQDEQDGDGGHRRRQAAQARAAREKVERIAAAHAALEGMQER